MILDQLKGVARPWGGSEDGLRGHRPQGQGAGEPASRGCPVVTLRSCLANGRQDPGLSVEVGMGSGRRFGEGRGVGWPQRRGSAGPQRARFFCACSDDSAEGVRAQHGGVLATRVAVP